MGLFGFFADSNLSQIPSSLFNINQLMTDVSYMFYGTKISKIENFTLFPTYQNISYCFANCTELTDASELILDTSANNIINYEGLFLNCSKLNYGPEIKFRHVTSLNLNYMYYNCNSLSSINVDIPKTSNINSYSMFENCSSLLDIPSGIKNFSSNNNFTFSNCLSLTGGFRQDLLKRVDYKNGVTTSFIGFFNNCTGITNDFFCELPDTIKNISGICRNCNNLISVTSGFFPLSTVYIESAVITGDESSDPSELTGIILVPVISSLVSGLIMDEVFYNCNNLTGDINVSGIIPIVSSAISAFYNTTALINYNEIPSDWK